MEEFLPRLLAFGGAACTSLLMVFYFATYLNAEWRIKPNHPLIWVCYGAGIGAAFPAFLLKSALITLSSWYLNVAENSVILTIIIVVPGVLAKLIAALFMLHNRVGNSHYCQVFLSAIAVASGLVLVQYLLFIISEPIWNLAAFLTGLVWISSHITSGVLIGLGLVILRQSISSLRGWILVAVFPLVVDFSSQYSLQMVFQSVQNDVMGNQFIEYWLMVIATVWVLQMVLWHLGMLKIQSMQRKVGSKATQEPSHVGVFSYVNWTVTHPGTWLSIALVWLLVGGMLLSIALEQTTWNGNDEQSLFLTIASMILGHAVLFALLSQKLHLTTHPEQHW